MDFRKLDYILAIAEHKTLMRAAESLYVGQPTLSKYLSALEAELGLKLFVRIGNHYEPTYAGSCYIKRAGQIRRIKDELDEEMNNIRQNNISVLNVAFAKMRISYLLPEVLPIYRRKYPNVRVNVFEGDSDENDALLRSGAVDVAFYSSTGEPDSDIDYHILTHEELLICTKHGHPLSEVAHINPNTPYPVLELKDLIDEPVILMQPRQRTRQIVDRLCHEHSVTLKNTLCLSSIPAIIRLVANGMGISFAFDTHIEHIPVKTPIDCYSICDERVFRNFVAATRKNQELTGYLLDFIETVREVAECGKQANRRQ